MKLLVVNRRNGKIENVFFHYLCGSTYPGLEVTDEFLLRMKMLYQTQNGVNSVKNSFNTVCYCASSGLNTVLKGKDFQNQIQKLEDINRYLIGSADEFTAGQKALKNIEEKIVNFDGSVVYIDWAFCKDGTPDFENTQVNWEDLVGMELLSSYSMVYPIEAKKLKNHHVDFKVMATEFHNVFLGFDKMDDQWKDGKHVFTLYIEE